MKIPRKVVIAGVASVLVAGMAGASAASLGVLGGSSLGSADSVVAACDTDGIDVAYATTLVFPAAPANPRTEVTTVTLNGVSNNCDTLDATVTLRSLSAVLGSPVTVTIPSDLASETVTFTIPAGVAAADVEGISVVIAG